MKKIAIITLHSVNNYGSVLQAYASQCYFEELGYEVEIIDYRRPWEVGLGYWFYINEKSCMGVARNVLYLPSKMIQFFKFHKFLKKNLKLTPNRYCRHKDFAENPIKADVFCTGSDQVWNSGWNGGIIAAYFLNFVKKDTKIKKISFASSFGDSSLEKEDLREIGEYLNDYDCITVREKNSVKMLSDEFRINSKEILDPTLQMDGVFWRKICKEDRYCNEKYVLLIQLNRNHRFDELAVDFAFRHNLKLIRLCLRVDQIMLPGSHVVIPNIEDYVRMIRDAEYVLTDSFHAVSFSLNLNRQFYVYYPEKYSERIKSILDMLELKNRELTNYKVEDKIEYTRINNALKYFRKIAKDYLRENLNDV